ncbi:hypothetical protein HMI55_005041 [Coelomomyces lativittatus]|nr:hypothetical protein HMI55_005041 [Coelomomyces lativittatus]
MNIRTKPRHHSEEQQRFLSTSFRFILTPGKEYSLICKDPNAFVPWENVEQVIIPTTTLPHCPICLSESPLIPRVTKCGHVYCFPCLLQLHAYPLLCGSGPSPLSSTSSWAFQKQPAWRYCPVCNDAMYLTDARPVRFWMYLPITLHLSPPPYTHLEFQLVRCATTSCLPHVVPMPPFTSCQQVPTCTDPMALIFSKYTLATSTYLHDEIHVPDQTVFTHLSEEQEMHLDPQVLQPWVNNVACSSASHVETTSSSTLSKTSPPPSSSSSSSSSSSTSTSKSLSNTCTLHDHYWFYQLADGQRGYVHPTSWKILHHVYGGGTNMPSTLTLACVRSQTSTYTSTLPIPFLHHLPNGTTFTLIEINPTDWIPASEYPAFETSSPWILPPAPLSNDDGPTQHKKTPSSSFPSSWSIEEEVMDEDLVVDPVDAYVDAFVSKSMHRKHKGAKR